MAQAVSQQPLTVGTQVQSQAVHVGYVIDEVPLGQVFFFLVLKFSLSVSFHECFMLIHSFICHRC